MSPPRDPRDASPRAGACKLVAMPANTDPAVRAHHLQCETCSALVPIEATRNLQPGVCPQSSGQVVASLP